MTTQGLVYKYRALQKKLFITVGAQSKSDTDKSDKSSPLFEIGQFKTLLPELHIFHQVLRKPCW